VSPSRSPDILVVMADQLAPAALPFHGDPVTRAPAMSELADRGVVFDAAYTGSPLCAPARAALLTGRLPSGTGAYDNAAGFASDVPTFAHYLRRAGYRTALAGKMHFCGPDQLHGFERRLTTDIYPADYGWTPDWTRPEYRPHWYHDMSSVVDAGPCVRSNQLDYDEEVGLAAEQALYDHVRSDDERPLCLVASFTHPHDPYTISQPWWDLYDGVDIPMPAFGYDDAVATAHERRLRQVCAMDDIEVTHEHVRAALRAYRGAISYVDQQVARLLDALRSTGRLEDTVVVLTSDHGDMLGERGLWYKMCFFEGAARVPLVIAAPDRFAPARVAAPVSTLDLLPTLVAVANNGDGSDVVGQIDGRSLYPMLAGDSVDRGDVVAEYLAEGAIAPMVMIRRGDLKLVHSPADPDQLYDLSADPLERWNLASEPGHASPLAQLRGEVAARWNLSELDHRVRESQRRRTTIVEALARGESVSWDYAPPYDAARRYVRNEKDLGEFEAASRFPRLPPPAPTGAECRTQPE
jgi:choline-sulfatase